MAGHAASHVVDKQGIQQDKDDKGVIKITETHEHYHPTPVEMVISSCIWGQVIKINYRRIRDVQNHVKGSTVLVGTLLPLTIAVRTRAKRIILNDRGAKIMSDILWPCQQNCGLCCLAAFLCLSVSLAPALFWAPKSNNQILAVWTDEAQHR